ncbi:electron transfer flavoprotein subunit alpha/FixB family protein [Corynebacterium renale]|uniref:Electron transfer flavoprotein alpha subunit apoprotein n=1 Tax=Corynebacterium renale TaxID=1724 RepID=A0A2A9DQ58_9CORY|nr:electron transfer flavoprotein subunit alpha/FixB family protein [Corynebacterium renale]PFG28897.1 electron transfer flavoprotein alpha subunit apoprotein [Corynebacterium renale]SQI25612.1 electron transfer flavoprotein subunit alpha [Corynebacterium renale]
MSQVYVLAPQSGGQVDPVAAELITAARVFGDVTAVVVGEPGVGSAVQPALAEAGAARVVSAEAPDYAQRLLLPEVDAVSILAAQNPAPIVLPATPAGNEIAGRLAARVASGVLCDVVALNPDRTARQSIFGDTVEVSSAVGGNSPIYTVRPGAVAANPQQAAGALDVLPLPGASVKDVKVTDFAPAVRGSRPELTQAKIVVCGGRGLGSKEEFERLVGGLADALGAAVGGTRDAVELGYIDGQYQVGQTGVTISPDVYIGVGISGAIQHTSGMQTSTKIIAINEDEDADIFKIADLGIVGDLFDIVPQLIDRLPQEN